MIFDDDLRVIPGKPGEWDRPGNRRTHNTHWADFPGGKFSSNRPRERTSMDAGRISEMQDEFDHDFQKVVGKNADGVVDSVVVVAKGPTAREFLTVVDNFEVQVNAVLDEAAQTDDQTAINEAQARALDEEIRERNTKTVPVSEGVRDTESR